MPDSGTDLGWVAKISSTQTPQDGENSLVPEVPWKFGYQSPHSLHSTDKPMRALAEILIYDDLLDCLSFVRAFIN